MIRKHQDEYLAECSECGHEYYGGTTDDFRAFVEELKAAGWLIRKDPEDGQWDHWCPSCMGEPEPRSKR